MADNAKDNPSSENKQSISKDAISSHAGSIVERVIPSGAETKGESLLEALERRINLTEGIMIGVAVVVALGFIAALIELGFIVNDTYMNKQESYHLLMQKIYEQEIAIHDLQKENNRQKK